MSSDLQQALDALFSLDSGLYRNRGFRRRIGFGTRPALLNIDLANAWTRPGHAFSCDGVDEIIAGVQRLLEAFRAKDLPVIYTTTAYDVTEGRNTDMGLWHKKIPAEELKSGTEAIEIDDRIPPRDSEIVIVKKQASAFHGTPLAGMLQAAGVDTVIVTGVTACACVRATIEDALANGFRPIAVRECIGDRIPGAVEWNLFDIDAKFGDVEQLEIVLDYLHRNDIG